MDFVSKEKRVKRRGDLDFFPKSMPLHFLFTSSLCLLRNLWYCVSSRWLISRHSISSPASERKESYDLPRRLYHLKGDIEEAESKLIRYCREPLWVFIPLVFFASLLTSLYYCKHMKEWVNGKPENGKPEDGACCQGERITWKDKEYKERQGKRGSCRGNLPLRSSNLLPLLVAEEFHSYSESRLCSIVPISRSPHKRSHSNE